MSGIEGEIKVIHDILKENAESIVEIRKRLNKLEGDK